jgi:hypothetical protein
MPLRCPRLLTRRSARSSALAVGALAVLSCSDGPTASATECDLENVTASLALAPLQGGSASYAVAESCVGLTSGGARYLVVPQLASGGEDEDPRERSYFLGNQEPSSAAASLRGTRSPLGSLRSGRPLTAQQRFDARLRAMEGALLPASIPAAALRSTETPPLAQFAARREFVTLGNVDGTDFEKVTADLVYTGDNILIYADTATPENGFTPLRILRFGDVFDQTLFPIDTAAFGRPTDIDGNGRLIVLMTPRVNALVSETECLADGFITGYFFGFDLVSTDVNRSNRGEVFYMLTPDVSGEFSCEHSVNEVADLVPSTFIHELQHMISYGAHVIQRGSLRDEETWLNEGLSLIAEELGSLYYEEKYPPGTCGPGIRTDCEQLFPDSSQGFIVSNLQYAFDWMATAPEISVTTFASSGTFEERGAAFLFLRWLGDHKPGVFRALVQTGLRGTANVTNAAGEPFPVLFADFGISLYTDSIPGLERTAVPPRYRFLSRNLRKIHERFASLGSSFPPAYPIQPKPLVPFGGLRGSMVQGTMDWYILETPAGASAVPLHLVRQDLRPLGAALVPQLGVFRLPD